MGTRRGAFALLALLCIEYASATSVTPVEQVLNMMRKMTAKGEEMQAEEKRIMTEYDEWVKKELWDLSCEIKNAVRKIEDLTGFIEKTDAKVSSLGNNINELNTDIDQMTAELAAHNKQCSAEHAEFLLNEQDHSESVDALTRAIEVLSAEDYDRAQAADMLQTMAKTSPAMRKVLGAFLEQGETGAPAVDAYEFQSGGILELLGKLKKQFSDELAEIQRLEGERAHGCTLIRMDLESNIKFFTKDREEKSALMKEKQSASAEAKGELMVTQREKGEDETTSREVESTHVSKTEQFEVNQKVRTAELEALKKATEIIANPEVAGTYAKQINFLQMQASASHTQKIASFLKSRAVALQSKNLSLLASQISGPNNPAFEKVIGMIDTLLEKLKQEAAEEADHKAWCDEQLAENKQARVKFDNAMDTHRSTVKSLEATIAEQAETIATLIKEQKELNEQRTTETKIRNEEKAFNLESIANAKAGKEAVGRALVVLREFYDKQAFVQTGEAPEMAAYSGMGEANKGVVGMLEVIETDFQREESEHTFDEQNNAQAYKSMMAQTKVALEEKHDEQYQTELDKDAKEYDLKNENKAMGQTAVQQSDANKYHEELKPACLTVKVSYEERVAQRDQEIAALKQAYEALR